MYRVDTLKQTQSNIKQTKSNTELTRSNTEWTLLLINRHNKKKYNDRY